MNKPIPTTAELLARMRKEMGHCLNIKDAAQKQYDALDRMCKGIGNTKKDNIPTVTANGEALVASRQATLESVNAMVEYVNED